MLLVCSLSTKSYYQYFQTEVFVVGTHSACEKIITALFSWSEAQGGAEGNTLFLSVLIKDSWWIYYILVECAVSATNTCDLFLFWLRVHLKVASTAVHAGHKAFFSFSSQIFLFQVVCWWTQDVLYFTVRTILSGGGLLRKTSRYITQQRLWI